MSTNEWLRIRLDIFRDPAVIRLAELMMTDRATTVGMLVHFWSWCNEQSDNGHVNVTAEFVDSHVAHVAKRPPRKAKTFVNSMVFVGWLALEEIDGVEVVAVPEFERYMSESSKKRALERIRKESVRKTTDKSRNNRGRFAEDSRNNRGKSADQEQEVRNENVERDNTQQDRVRVLDMLSGEGITGGGAQALFDGGATPADVTNAIAYADGMNPPPRSRTGSIIDAVRKRYGPAEKAKPLAPMPECPKCKCPVTWETNDAGFRECEDCVHRFKMEPTEVGK